MAGGAFFGSSFFTISDAALNKQCFALCKGLTYVCIPASVAVIADDAFGKCDRLTIHGESGSFARSYAA
ncbi:MAG: hypothetical protein IJK98_09130, partial [Clostridia bacterium]|nr:hypothetical protein [Clostridia bacterium]